MPNWCDNNLFLKHDNPEMIQRAEDAFNKGRLMTEFLPCPKELTETIAGFCGAGTYEQELLEFKEKLNLKWFGSSNWYDWNISNWGTKWDVGIECGGGSGQATRESDNELILSFMSAWSPPIEFYAKLEELGFEVIAYYYESGCAFCGRYENGYDECYNIDGNSKWVIDNIPEYIDQEMGISEGMECWEEDNQEENENA